MFSRKCGKKIKSITKTFYKKGYFGAVIILVGCVVFSGVGCSSKSETEMEVIEKLREITTLKKEEDIYVFENDSSLKWKLRYTEGNEAVRFEEKAIEECFNKVFGEGCLEREEFTYDLSENAARIYLDTEVEEGNLSIINYDIDKDEITVMIDGERYSASDSIEEVMEENNLLEVMEKDIDKFKSQLEENDISIEALMDLQFEDIRDYLEEKDEKVPAVETDNSEETEKVEETDDIEETEITLALTVVNNTGVDIYELYASTVDVDDWEEDILEYDILEDGESVVINFTYLSNQTEWDLAMADAEGEMIEFYGLDFSKFSSFGTSEATLTLEYDGENGYANLE